MLKPLNIGFHILNVRKKEIELRFKETFSIAD